MNYILKSAAQVCSLVFLSVAFHPSKFSLLSPFFFYQLFGVSPSVLAFPTVAVHEGWLGPPSPVCVSVPLASVFCQPSWVSAPRTGWGASLGRPTLRFVCSWVGLEGSKGRNGGYWLSPGALEHQSYSTCQGASCPDQVASCLGRPSTQQHPPEAGGGWGREESAEGSRQKL